MTGTGKKRSDAGTSDGDRGSRKEKTARPSPIRWDSLSSLEKDELLGLAKRIALREAKRIQDRYGTHALGIGVGFRTKGKRKRTFRELVLRFYVLEKWAPGAVKDDGQHIPLTLSITIGRGTRRRRVQIPTDVNSLAGGHLQRTSVVVRPASGGSGMFGSICCVVRDLQERDMFLLSCEHVFGLLSRTTDCRPIMGVRIHACQPDEEDVATIDRPTDLAPLHPDIDKFSLDAGLARILRPTIFQRETGRTPLRSVLRDENQVQPGDRLKVLANSGVLQASVTGIVTFVRLPVVCAGRPHFWLFRRLIEYAPYPETIPGDSGSPLASGNTLVGMHFYLQEGPPGHAFAMLAKDVLALSTFGRPLAFVPE